MTTMVATGMDPIVRDGVDTDGPALAGLIASVFAEYEDCPYIPDEFPELQAPASHFAGLGGRLWVIECAGALVGSLAVAPSWREGETELFKVYLAPAWRGRGLASRLLALASDWSRESGATRLSLWSDTRFENGHRFYRRQKFQQRPGSRLLHDVGRSLEYRFVRDLDEAGPPSR